MSGEYQYKYPATNQWGDFLWELCWDYDADRANTSCQWNWLGRSVADYNVFGHPVSIHPSGREAKKNPVWGEKGHRQSSAGEFHHRSWLDHNWIQSGQGVERLYYLVKRVTENYQLLPTKPVVHSEGLYENGKEDGVDAYQIRWQAWSAYLNGAAGHTYGASGVWQFYDPGSFGSGNFEPWDKTPWREALGYPGGADLTHLYDFFSGLDWWRLVPHRDWLLVSGSPPPMPTREDISPPHLAVVPGELYLIYVPRKSAGKQTTVVNVVDGEYRAERFNPRNGNVSFINDGGPLLITDSEWQIPSRRYSDNQDWVFKLVSTASTSPFVKSLLATWLTDDQQFDENEDGRTNSLDFAQLVR